MTLQGSPASYSSGHLVEGLVLMMRCHGPPAGGFCPGGSNGEITPLKSELNFWRSSANATELFRQALALHLPQSGSSGAQNVQSCRRIHAWGQVSSNMHLSRKATNQQPAPSSGAGALFRCPDGSCMGTPEYSGDAVGDAACTNGTRGPVCAVCEQDYYLFSGACSYAPMP